MDIEMRHTEETGGPVMTQGFRVSKPIGDVPDANELAATASFSAFWAWLFAIFFSNTLSATGDPSLVGMPWLKAISLAGQSIGFAIVFLTARRRIPRAARAVTIAGSAIGPLIAALAIVPLFCPSPIPEALWIVAWLAAGIGSAFAVTAISRILTAMPPLRSAIVCATSMTAGAGLNLIVSLLVPPAAVIITGILLPASVVLIGLAREPFDLDAPATESTSDPSSPMGSQMVHLFAVIGFYSLVYGLACSVCLALPMGLATKAVFGASIIAAGVLQLAGVVIKGMHNGVEKVEAPALALIAIGLTPMPFLDHWGVILCSALLLAAWNFFDVSCLVSIFETSRELERPHIGTFALGRFVNTTGMAIGWAIGWVVYGSKAGSPADLIPIVLVLNIVLVLWLAFGAQRTIANRPEPAFPAPEPLNDKHAYDDAVDTVARAFGLSPREREVCLYLGRGRNSEYIEKQLFVSRNTVKSHTHRIYQKVGVHSQQELMDVVDRAQSGSLDT